MKQTKHGINKEWHKQHLMPRNATIAQRMEWHIAHAANCGCRPMPAKIKEMIATESASTKQ